MLKVLVIRNDKIGDFMLAWPSFAMLKQSLPSCQITALVPNYTAALAKLCPWIDNVIVDCTKNATKEQQKNLVQNIKEQAFDASICLFSNGYNAKLVWRSKIPYRLAPATKLSQLLYNHRLTQRRSHSKKPEYEYNLDLIRYFLKDNGYSVIEPTGPYLQFSDTELKSQRQKLCKTLNLDINKPWCYVHAGTGGSSNGLSISQYVDLIHGIVAIKPFQIILTAGPGEEKQAQELYNKLSTKIKAVVYSKNDGLADFTRSIACADLLIAGSTGPLHIAATIDVLTVGFFPSNLVSTPLRWKTLNSNGRHLAFCPPQEKGKEKDMSLINVKNVLVDIEKWLD